MRDFCQVMIEAQSVCPREGGHQLVRMAFQSDGLVKHQCPSYGTKTERHA